MVPPAFLISLRDLKAPAGVQPCVGVTRGLNTAARDHNAPLFFNFVLVYFSNGAQVSVPCRAAVKDSVVGPPFDDQHILLDMSIDKQLDGSLIPPVDARSPVTCSLRVTFVDPQTNTAHELFAPQLSQTTIP